jgi:hypothetical protein
MNKRKESKEIANIYCEEYSKKSYKELLSLKYPIELEITHNDKRYKIEIIRVIEDDSCLEFIDISVCVSYNILTVLIPIAASFTKYEDERTEILKY